MSHEPSVFIAFLSHIAASTQCHPQSTATHGSCYINARATYSGDGYCRCPNMDYRDECTCLSKLNEFLTTTYTLYEYLFSLLHATTVKFVSLKRLLLMTTLLGHQHTGDVHKSPPVVWLMITVITQFMSYPQSYKTHSQHPGAVIQPGTVDIHISVIGEDDKPLILILTSHYPIKWRLNVPDGVVFDKVIVVSNRSMALIFK